MPERLFQAAVLCALAVVVCMLLAAFCWLNGADATEPLPSVRLGVLTDQIHLLPLGPERDAFVAEHHQLSDEIDARSDGRCVGPHLVLRATSECPCGLSDATFAAVTTLLLKDCGGCQRSEVWSAPPGPPCHGRLLGITAPTPITHALH